MQRRHLTGMLLSAAILATAPAGASGLLSKSYAFKAGVTLAIGAATENGVRLDSVLFEIPDPVGGRLLRTGGLVRVKVAVSNTSDKQRKIGIVFALYDGEDRLLGVASGGSRVLGLKPDRQKRFTLIFDNVNSEAFKAKTFQVTLETKN